MFASEEHTTLMFALVVRSDSDNIVRHFVDLDFDKRNFFGPFSFK